MKKRYIGGILLLSLAVCITVTASSAKSRTTEIHAFLYDPCGGCFTGEVPCKPCRAVLELESYLYEQLDAENVRNRFSVISHNLLKVNERDDFEAITGKSFSGQKKFPVVAVNGQLLIGWPEIKDNFKEAVSEKEKPEAKRPKGNISKEKEIILKETAEPVIVYFKVNGCKDCKTIEQYYDDNHEIFDEIGWVTYNLSDSGAMSVFSKYCEFYQINEEDATVPLMIIGKRYLEGAAEIESYIQKYLDLGYANNTMLPEA